MTLNHVVCDNEVKEEQAKAERGKLEYFKITLKK